MGHYSIYNGYREKRRKPYIFVYAVLPISLLVFSTYAFLKSSPDSTKASTPLNAEVTAEAAKPKKKLISPLPWPNYGQAAYGVVDDGVLAESSEIAHPVPIASLAKVITALAILEKKPLAEGEQGPMITLSAQDELLYQKYIFKNGSVLPVKAGVQISQYQAMQAMLMISANNISDSLAIWAFGSMEEYNTYANDMLRKLGFSETVVADASGFSPDTKGTASEMVQLGILYIKNPLLRSIAMETKAEMPFAGTISNYNSAINENGVLGLKIGYTDEAGRTFLAADIKNDVDEASVVAVFGADHLHTAMYDAKNLLDTGEQEVKQGRFDIEN